MATAFPFSMFPGDSCADNLIWFVIYIFCYQIKLKKSIIRDGNNKKFYFSI